MEGQRIYFANGGALNYLRGTPDAVRLVRAVPINDIFIPSTSFVRGVHVDLDPGGFGADLLLNFPKGEDAPNAAEWDFNVLVAGRYNLLATYTTLVSRPVDISFNGITTFSNVLVGATAGWFSSNVQTIPVGEVSLSNGANTMRVTRSSAFPHIQGFQLVYLGPSN